MNGTFAFRMEFDISRLQNMIAAAGKQAPGAINRALNRAGDMARTAMVRELVPQTGLKYGVIRRALRVDRATRVSGSVYVIRSKGGNIRLKFFKATETRKGATAAPRGSRRLFAGSFIKGGRFPNRVALKMGGNVFRRAGKARKSLVLVRSGVFIPEDMVSRASANAFFTISQTVLPRRLAHELLRILS